jgi:hypothetical protein
MIYKVDQNNVLGMGWSKTHWYMQTRLDESSSCIAQTVKSSKAAKVFWLEDIINKYLTTKRITSLKGTITLFLVMHVGVMV